MSAILNDAVRKEFLSSVGVLGDGESMVVDVRGLTKFSFVPGSALRAVGTLAVSATAEKFKTTTTATFVIAGATLTKAATDLLVFSGSYTINTAAAVGDFWGAFLVQVNAAGTISTKAVSTDQAYTTEALAIAALPSVDSGNAVLGYITVQANSDVDWEANTDDLTAASDCQAVNFVDAGATVSYSAVDSLTATAHIGTAATGATLGTMVTVAAAWPFYLVSVAGLAGARVAVL